MTRAQLGTIATAVGATILAMSLLIALPIFGASAFGLSGVVLGAVLLIAGGLLTPSTPSTTTTTTTTTPKLWRVLPLLSPVMLVVGLFAVHRLQALGVEIDVTNAGTNTLAEESVLVARGLVSAVQIVSFVDDDRAQLELRALVDRYRAVAPNVTFEQRSVKRADDLDRARALGVAEYLALGGANVVVTTDSAEVDAPAPVRLRFVAGLPDQEQQLTNALRRVTTTTTTRVYLVSGHGEPDTRDEGPLGLSRLTASLAARGVQLVPLPLVAVGRVPEDARGLLLLSGTTAIDAAEQAVIAAGIERGVAVVIAVEPDRPSAFLNQLAASVGVDVVDDVVVDESPFSAMLGGADLASGQTQLAHPVTRSLRGALTHFPRAAVLGISPLDDGAAVEATPLVSTGGEARSQRTNARGPLPLVVAVEKFAGGKGTPARKSLWRSIVAADASFLENMHLGKGANADLALNALLWLTSTDDAIVVRPRAKTGALVFMTPRGRETLTFVLLVLVPGLLLALAVGLGAFRRSR